MKTKISLFNLLTMFVNFSLLAQSGLLDSTFSSDGKVTTAIGFADEAGWSVALQSDGKIVVAGYSYIGTNHDFALVRYNPDGILDNTFGSIGKITTDFGSSDDFGYSVAVQSDGKIVVAGSRNNGAGEDFALVRYNPDGSLDNTFDTDGKVTTDFGSANDEGFSVALQSDGKIVVMGQSYIGGNYVVALVRYNTNGSLDNTFDSDGKVTTDFGSTSNFGLSVAIQTDGKIVVAGWTDTGTDHDFALARYNPDGSLDNSFDTDGIVTTDFGSSDDHGLSVAIQTDGKIVVAGWTDTGTDHDFALARYNPDGSLDNSFDTDGIVTTAIGSFRDDGNSVAIQTDGKIVVAGWTDGYDFALVRYNPDGSLDNSFDTDGKVTTDFGSDYDNGYSVAVQSDGKIVVAGRVNNGSDDDFAVVRYNGDTGSICTITVYDTVTVNDTIIFNDTITTNIYDTTFVTVNDTVITNDTVTTYISVTDTLIINAVLTGINPPNNINTLRVFPNPANTHLVIDNGNYNSMNGYTIRIDNSLGQTVFQSLVTQQQFDIDLSSWSGKGTYFIYIIDNSSNTIDTRKIILQ